MCKPIQGQTTIATYDLALQQADREAFWTLVAAVVIAAFFWGAIFLLRDETIVWWGIPIWAWVAIAGGYLVSIGAVWMLVRFVFRNFSLALRPEDKL